MGYRHSRPARRRPATGPTTTCGAMALEFGLILVVLISLVVFVAELYRVALIDITLARATHRAALAAGRGGATCDAVFEHYFVRGDAPVGWLLDTNGSGSIEFVAGDTPGTADVSVDVAADNGVIGDGVVFAPGCGVPGSWIQVRTAVTIQTRFGPEITRRASSWAVHQ